MQRPRGTEDLLPPATDHWQWVEATARRVARGFGYREIRTPVFEHTELFARGAGETTDVVEKEMYTFLDKGGRSLTLRPESTAAVARAVLEAGAAGQRHKLYYLQSHFRYERPQLGRLRQHHQFGVEFLGEAGAGADVEVILLARDFLAAVGLGGLSVRLNSIGDATCRPAYRQALVEFFRSRQDQLCQDCRRRLDTNPMRILDCKVPTCVAARSGHPRALDYLCDDCQAHFTAVQSLLNELGVPFTVDPTIVRGLDYYTRTVFEITATDAADQAVCGGGRYDGLMEVLGGPATPGVGFGLGLERLLHLLAGRGMLPPAPPAADVYVALTSERLMGSAFALAEELRHAGVGVACDVSLRGLKAQLRQADRMGAKAALILGEREAERHEVTYRRLGDGEQVAVGRAEVVAYLKEELTR